jgi:hypothetical protein
MGPTKIYRKVIAGHDGSNSAGTEGLGYWDKELMSLGISPSKRNELNDWTELEALTENIKQMYYQDYKSAYSSDDDHIVV